jgi:hypothetical protein
VPHPDFDRHVFINCPFDRQYEPILQSILFCVVYLGFVPRIATENNNGGQNRVERIISLIHESKYSIHDLSRCQAQAVGEHFRLNMPFELGIDYGCRQYGAMRQKEKSFLILEEQRYRYQAALSDIAGCDIEFHERQYQKAVRKVRNWLAGEARIDRPPGATRILAAYETFQGWYYERQVSSGFSDEDIQDYSTPELLAAMSEWVEYGHLI